MPTSPAYPIPRYAHPDVLLSTIMMVLLLPVAVGCQSGGSPASVGTGGSHIISGKIFFPSGRRLDNSIQIKLQSYTAGEISTMSDQSGSFTFGSLAPGNYIVVVNAGDDYEVARENITIDSDISLSRLGLPTPPMARRYTVMITLQLKRDSGNLAKASVVNAALAEVPENARVLYEKGVQFARDGDSSKAIDDLRQAVSLYPRFPLALTELGVQYLRFGQANKAIEPLKSAMKLTPEAFTPQLNLGIALLETNQFAEAETQLRKALKLNDAAATGHMYLGVALTKLRNYPEAEKELRRCLETGGNQLGLAHRYLGGIYWQQHEYKRAADELETYLRLTPNAQDSERVRGVIRELRSKS